MKINRKLIRKIIIAAIFIGIAIGCAAGIRFTGVSDYERQQESLRQQLVQDSAGGETESVFDTQQAAQFTQNSEGLSVPAEASPTESMQELQDGQTQGPASNGGLSNGGLSNGSLSNGSLSNGGLASSQGETKPEQTDASWGSEEPEQVISCRIAISCKVLAQNRDAVKNPELLKYIPDDGEILKEVTLQVKEGASAYDALSMACKAFGIQMESKYTALYGTYYVQGIHYLYEKCAGDRSGWIYMVNGKTISVGASGYKLKDGDCVTWHFTVDGGKDVGY